VLHYVVLSALIVVKLWLQFHTNAVAIELIVTLRDHPQRAFLNNSQLGGALIWIEVLHDTHFIVCWEGTASGVEQPSSLLQLDMEDYLAKAPNHLRVLSSKAVYLRLIVWVAVNEFDLRVSGFAVARARLREKPGPFVHCIFQ